MLDSPRQAKKSNLENNPFMTENDDPFALGVGEIQGLFYMKNQNKALEKQESNSSVQLVKEGLQRQESEDSLARDVPVVREVTQQIKPMPQFDIHSPSQAGSPQKSNNLSPDKSANSRSIITPHKASFNKKKFSPRIGDEEEDLGIELEFQFSMEEDEQEGAPMKAFEQIVPKSARNQSDFSLNEAQQANHRFTFAKSLN